MSIVLKSKTTLRILDIIPVKVIPKGNFKTVVRDFEKDYIVETRREDKANGTV